MVIDKEQLNKAKTAGARMAEAERQAVVARADYHTAIRRLHLAGASFRELAHELDLSHQRVQQIVDGAGGTWWQRVWRTRVAYRDAVCTFCERPPSEVNKLLAGPNVYICDGCIEKAEAAAGRKGTAGKHAAEGALSLAPGRAKVKCSFCGKRRAADRPVVVAPEASVCVPCLEICRQIVDDRSPA